MNLYVVFGFCNDFTFYENDSRRHRIKDVHKYHYIIQMYLTYASHIL